MRGCHRWSVALLAVALQPTQPAHRHESLPISPPKFAESLPELSQQVQALLADELTPAGSRCAPEKHIDTLVLEGGGVKGIAYGGGACALEAAGVLDSITTFRGTSAGAIAAALLASGMGCEAMHAALWSVRFDELVDSGGILSSLEQLRSHYGLHDGAQIQHYVEQLLALQLGNSSGNITFSELWHRTNKNLQIAATSLTTSRLKFFDAYRTPDVPVALAVRASSTIPLVFTPAIIDGEMFVDGGLLRNMPIEHSDSSTAAATILALGLRSPRLQLFGDAKPQVTSLQSFIVQLYGTVLWGPDSANSLLAARQTNVEYLPIDSRGVSGRDFVLGSAQKRELVSSGFVAVMSQLVRCRRTQEWPWDKLHNGATAPLYTY